MPNQPLDPSVLALTKAIGKQENGGTPQSYDFSKVGVDGERGAYQMTPAWIASNAPTYLKGQTYDPKNLTAAQQDELAYKVVEARGKAGLTPAQIASEWNSGNKDAYTQNHVGTSPGGAAYDTPGYVNNVAKYYEQYKGQSTTNNYNPTPYSKPSGGANPGAVDYSGMTKTTDIPTTPDTSLGGQLGGRVNEASQAITDTASGKQNIFSGLLQTVGAAAGGIGDIVNKGIEMIPGVKAIEGVIGSGVSTLAQTDGGKAIIKSMQDFGTAHPEFSKDLGAGFNILTAIPILRGLGVVKDIALNGASSALKGMAEKTFTTEASSVVGKSASGAKFLRQNPTVIKDMIDERMIPDIKGTTYDIAGTLDESEKTLNSLNASIESSLKNQQASRVADESKTVIDNVLNGYTDRNGNVIQGFKNSNFTPQEILDTGKGLTPQNGKLWDKFASGNATMPEINQLRMDLDSAVKSVYTSMSEPPIKKDIGATLSGALRELVQTTVPETQAPFARMTKIFKVQKALEHMSQKPVKPGMVGGFIKSSTSGVPIVSHVGNITASKLAGATTGILKKTGKKATRVGAKEAKSKIKGLIGGALTQKASGQ